MTKEKLKFIFNKSLNQSDQFWLDCRFVDFLQYYKIFGETLFCNLSSQLKNIVEVLIVPTEWVKHKICHKLINQNLPNLVSNHVMG